MKCSEVNDWLPVDCAGNKKPPVEATVVTLNVSDTPPIVSVAFDTVPLVAAEVTFTATVFPFETVPAAVVNAPPFTEYEPPEMLIAVAALIPETVIVFEVIAVFNATFVWSVKLNAFGVVSEPVAASVVTLNVSFTPPMVRTTSFFVLFVVADVTRTLTVAPFESVVLLVRYAPPFTENEPPVTLIDVLALMPPTVIVFEVMTAFNATFVWSVNVN